LVRLRFGSAKWRSVYRVESHLTAFAGPWGDDRTLGRGFGHPGIRELARGAPTRKAILQDIVRNSQIGTILQRTQISLPRRIQKGEWHGISASHPFAQNAKGWGTPQLWSTSKIKTGERRGHPPALPGPFSAQSADLRPGFCRSLATVNSSGQECPLYIPGFPV